MINVIDVVLAVLVVVQLFKSLGGPVKIIKGLLFILFSLIIFGIIARLLIEAPLPKPARKPFEDSYFVKLSHIIIKWVYPAIEKSAPPVNTFIKSKIISSPTAEVTPPKIVIPDKILPKLTLPEMPKLK